MWVVEGDRGHWEPNTARILMDAVRGGRVAVDVGAHIGVDTVHMALAGGLVIAVEPDRRNLPLLLANLKLNGVEGRMRVVPAAACARSGRAKLYLAESTIIALSASPSPIIPETEIRRQ